MKNSLQEYCKENNMEYLLEQWDCEKNMDLTPGSISFGSNKKVWWRCANGHEWKTKVCLRTMGRNCPVCAGHVLVPGLNDFQTMHPELAELWNFEKNGNLMPDHVFSNSRETVWWRCANGHEWKAQIKSRIAGGGCPICKNRVLLPGTNDLGTTNPEIAKQWHSTKNETLTPRDVFAGSKKKIWWRCEKEHEWQASIYSRCRGHGCPVCTGRMTVPGVNDLASALPDIAFEWHPTKNGDLTPEMVTVNSNRKVWWKCDREHEWEANVSTRTRLRSKCPYCAGRMVWPGFNDLGYKFPDIAAQWHPVLNGELTPNKVTTGSSKSVWWKCELGHTWKAVIYSRTALKNPTGCPVCAGRGSGSYQERYSEALKEEN